MPAKKIGKVEEIDAKIAELRKEQKVAIEKEEAAAAKKKALAEAKSRKASADYAAKRAQAKHLCKSAEGIVKHAVRMIQAGKSKGHDEKLIELIIKHEAKRNAPDPKPKAKAKDEDVSSEE